MALSGNGQRYFGYGILDRFSVAFALNAAFNMEIWNMKQNITNKVELLAPAGNYESFLGAINAGADAVYLGGSKFGARAYADNFTDEEICKAIRYAHLFGKKVYLTVNTLIKDSELPELIPYLDPFCKEGLDGVIVQDIGAFLTIKEAFPKLALHVSTQMTVTGSYAANLLKDMGAVRIVPARELSLEEIRTLKQETGLELETFIHGAMCYCYSGQCLFSSMLGGRSGNRGRCAQPCRLPYQVSEFEAEKQTGINKAKNNAGNEQYPLSLKDMCSIAFLPQLIEAGIDSFKIEGRMKKPEYAAGVTAVYRKYIDLYYRVGAKNYTIEEADIKQLSSLYIRSGIQDGYYFKHNGADMITLSSPAYSGSDESLLSSVRRQYLETVPKKEISMYASFETGSPCTLTLICGEISVTVYGDMVQKASNQPISSENVLKSLLKLGNTPFSVNKDDIMITVSDSAFYSLKALNELRRNGVEELERKINKAFIENEVEKSLCFSATDTSAYQTPHAMELYSEEENQREKQKEDYNAKNKNSGVHILVSTADQLAAVRQYAGNVDVLYLDMGLSCLSPDFIEECKKMCWNGKSASVYIALPYIVRKKDISDLEKLLPVMNAAHGVLVRNMESYGFLRKIGYRGRINTDAGVYTFNKPSLKFWQNKTEVCCVPYELNKKELRRLCEGDFKTEQVVYGRIPLMVTANCVAKTTKGCRRNTGNDKGYFILTDRYHKNFPVTTVCKQCYNIIYNAVPLSLHDKVINRELRSALRLQFTVENREETGKILRFWNAVFQGEKEQPPYAEYTTGHEKRGVE